MSEININGLLLPIGFVLVYLLTSILRNYVFGSDSLKNYEKLNRSLLISGGIILGAFFGSYSRQGVEFGLNEVLMLLAVLLGSGFIIIGSYILKSFLWTPLEQISEYSAEFGSNFVATKLPLIGGKELKMFSHRFNKNILTIANKISEIEIQIDLLQEGVNQFISAGDDLSSETFNLEDFVNKYSIITDRQNTILHRLEDQAAEFITWYNQSQEKLNERFIQIRALSELGNLISINASIESSNLDVPNPGFETIAAKLHELAQELDETQESLRVLLLDIGKNYDDFNRNLTTNISETLEISREVTELSNKVEQVIEKVKINENGFRNSSQNLKSVLVTVTSNLPNAY